MQKNLVDRIIKITIPAHKPVKINTLRVILKQAEIDLEEFKMNL